MKKAGKSISGHILLEILMLGILMAVIFVSVAGCPPDPDRIVVNPGSATVSRTHTFQFAAKGYDENGKEVTFTATWASSNTQVGTIDSHGLFTAAGYGTCKVSATAGKVVGTATVEVPPLSRIEVHPDNATVVHNQTQQFEAVGYDAVGGQVPISPTWSCDPSVGTIDQNGLFTASGYGTGQVMATEGTISGSATVDVPTVFRIVVTPEERKVDHGNTYQFTAKGYNVNGEEVPITPVWTIADPDVGTISQTGLFTATGRGTCKIEAAVGGTKGTTRVQVPTYLSGTITSNMTLQKRYNPYILTTTNYRNPPSLIVAEGATLTIESGVVVKGDYSDNSELMASIRVDGKLVSNGTQDDPVYFTSIRDDAVWGDTNNDGNATQPTAGNWGGITLENNTVGRESNLSYTLIRYGGHSGWAKMSGLVIAGGAHNLSHCTITDMGYGLGCSLRITGGAPQIDSTDITGSGTGPNSVSITGGSPTISNCNISGGTVSAGGSGSPTITGCQVHDIGGNGIVGGGTITGNTVTGCSGVAIVLGGSSPNNVRNNHGSGNGQNGIHVSGTYSQDAVWNSTNCLNDPKRECLPYILPATWWGSNPTWTLTIEQGATLTIELGVVVKGWYGTGEWANEWSSSIDVKGRLITQGTASDPVWFTSIKDDAVWGDTNNDAGATQPTAGSWGGIALENGTAGQESNLTYTRVRYGGCSGWNSRSAFRITGGSHTLSHGGVTDSYISGSLVITGGDPRIEGTDITGSGTGPNSVSITGGSPTISNCNISGGTVSARGGNPTVTGCQIHDVGSYGIMASTSATISGNAIQNCSSAIRVSGGTSNLNGNTVKFCNYGIWADSLAGESSISSNRTEMCDTYGIYVSSCSPAVTSNTVVGFEGTGLYLNNYEGRATANDISGCDYGVYTAGNCASARMTGNKIHDNWLFGEYNSDTRYVTATDNWWGDASGPSPYGMCNAVGGNIDVQPWQGQKVWYTRVNGHDPACPYRAEPVNVNTGNFSSSHTDLKFAGTGPQITINRNYNSLSCSDDGPFGYGWSFTYSARLVTYPYDDDDMMLIAPEGDSHRYKNNANGTYSPEDQDYSTLTHNPDGTWTISRKEGSWEKFNASGLITQIADTNQNILSITRDANGRATSVTDACSQTVTFYYNPDGTIDHITDPASRTISYAYDNGNLREVTDLNGGTTTYTYDEDHRMITVEDPEQNEFVNNTYDELNRVVSQTDFNGEEVGFTYDQGGHNNKFTDALGKDTTYQDDKKLAQTGEVDPKGKSSSIAYDNDGNVTSRTDKRGKTTSYTYDAAGNMLTETDPLNHITTHTYDAKGNCLTTTDPVLHTTTRTYDTKGNMLTETDPLLHMTTYTYDTAGRQLTSRDPMGRSTTNVYDARGNLTRVTNPDGGVTTNVYDSANRKTSTTDPVGNVTTYTYDDIGHLASMVDPEGHTTTFDYDSDGNQTSVTDPLNNTRETTYDEMGRVSSDIDPAGKATGYEYDANGNKTAEIDPPGNTTTHVYDELGREIETKDARNNSSFKTYDPEGNVLTETDREGKTTTNTYDDAGRVATTKDALNNTTTHAYDAAGREIETKDPQNHITTKSYDAAGRLTSTTDPASHTTTYAYDAAGNKTSETDPAGHTTNYAYDWMNRMTSTTDPAGRVVSYGYDRNGNRTWTRDGTGATTNFKYNGLGLITKATDPVFNSTTYAYDNAGRRISMTNPKGAITTYAYDICSRVTSETNTIGEATTYTYDDAGRITTMTDGEGVTTYTYDADSSVTGAAYPGGLTETASYDKNNKPLTRAGAGVTITLTYDALGRTRTASNASATTTATYDSEGNVTGKSLTYPTGSKSFTYSYNNLNQMTSSTEGGRTTNYTYDTVGRLSGKAYPNTISSAYSYDTGGQLSALDVKKGTQPVKSYALARDARANITSVTEDASQTTTYSYDASSRLTGENNPQMGNTTYAYDRDGNRTVKNKAGEPWVIYAYNNADELTSDTEGNAYTYNTRGDLTRVTKGSYHKDLSWDGKGRLTSIADTAGKSTSYTYDPLDRTYTSTEDSQTILHTYDMEGDVEIALLNPDLSLKALYQSGADGLISATTSQGTSYYSYNPHSDVSLITDSSGNTTKELHYDAWGNAKEDTTEPYTYLGKAQRRTYKTPGLIKMGARFYDPDTGRFISRDPLSGHDEIPISHNPYVYAYDDPVNLRDLSGEDAYSDGLRQEAQVWYALANTPFLGEGNRGYADFLMAQADLHDRLVAQGTVPAQNEQTPICEKEEYSGNNSEDVSIKNGFLNLFPIAKFTVFASVEIRVRTIVKGFQVQKSRLEARGYMSMTPGPGLNKSGMYSWLVGETGLRVDLLEDPKMSIDIDSAKPLPMEPTGYCRNTLMPDPNASTNMGFRGSRESTRDKLLPRRASAKVVFVVGRIEGWTGSSACTVDIFI